MTPMWNCTYAWCPVPLGFFLKSQSPPDAYRRACSGRPRRLPNRIVCVCFWAIPLRACAGPKSFGPSQRSHRHPTFIKRPSLQRLRPLTSIVPTGDLSLATEPLAYLATHTHTHTHSGPFYLESWISSNLQRQPRTSTSNVNLKINHNISRRASTYCGLDCRPPPPGPDMGFGKILTAATTSRSSKHFSLFEIR